MSECVGFWLDGARLCMRSDCGLSEVFFIFHYCFERSMVVVFFEILWF